MDGASSWASSQVPVRPRQGGCLCEPPRGYKECGDGAEGLMHSLMGGASHAVIPDVNHMHHVHSRREKNVRRMLDQGEWSLYLDVFPQICLRWYIPYVHLQVSLLNRKVLRFVTRARDSLEDVTDFLMRSWGHYRLTYAFPSQALS